MTQFVENLMSRASKLSKTIALAEGTDVRAAKAAEILTQKNVCKVVLIGNEEEIKTKFPEIDFTGVSFDDPKTSEHRAEYANTLYELRKAKGWSQARLAEESEIEPSNISHIERAATKLSLPTLVSIANALNVSLDEVVYGSLIKSAHISSKIIDDMLSDCTPDELKSVAEIIKATKHILRNK